MSLWSLIRRDICGFGGIRKKSITVIGLTKRLANGLHIRGDKQI